MQIEQLKKHKIRGHTIIVWSAGGSKWAAEAIKFLELEAYVDLVIEKPRWMYDDKQAEEFMPRSQYFKVD
jgi:phosphoserine phosphatase